MAKNGPRILAYSHDGYGLGHLRRNVRIVSGLRSRRPDVDALVVTGAKAAQMVVSPFGLEWLRLPAVVKVANGRYEVDEEHDRGTDVMAYRASIIADAVRTFRPDLVLVDRYPRGLHDELAPALNELQCRSPQATLVLGLRDILDDAATVRDEWDRSGHSQAIRDLYRMVLLYGDPHVFDAVTEYRLPAEVAAKIRYAGYLADDVNACAAEVVRREFTSPGRRLVVCTLGGGRDAYPIATAFLASARDLARRGWDALLITGPYMTYDEVVALRSQQMTSGARMLEMVQDLPSHLAAADAAVCMGGYNTMCEVLATSTPVVVIPRVRPRREQLMRSERFESLGLVSTLHPRHLSPERLAKAIARTAEARPRDHERRLKAARVAHHGVATAAARLDSLLPMPAAVP